MWNISYFPKRVSYQFLAIKDVYIQTTYVTNSYRGFTKPYDPLLNFDLYT